MTSGEEVDQVDKRYRVPQDCPFQSALRIYSSPCAKVLSMRLKEQRGSPMMVWYCGGSLRRVKHDACLDALVAFASKWYPS
ncbi:MAG TPA: hypothetical protein VFD60_11335 [Nitrososphaeraceae archaeon]|nr:hypothetical protein [Nitrososphaeraceae archaeon]